MEFFINDDIPFQLAPDDAARILRVQDDDMEEFEALFRQCMRAAKPKYAFAVLPVSARNEKTRIGNAEFDSRILRINLTGLSRAFAAIASCGKELFALYNACEDVLQKYWIDGICEIAMDQAASALRRHIRSITAGEIRSMSPGSLDDFPIIEQKKLFALLNHLPERIGVELTASCLMLPHKSVSAIYFESEEEYENCMLCLREGCTKRRAEFDEQAFSEKYGLLK